MKKILFAFAMATVGLGFTACDDDEKIEVKDYGMKTFEADLKYSSTMHPDGYPISTYAQQTYFAFGNPEALALGEVDTDSWTQFNVFDYAANEMEVPEGYVVNKRSEVDAWDLLFTKYHGTTQTSDGQSTGYDMTGILLNMEGGMKVAEMVYDESSDINAVSKAFADLIISDVEGLSYSDDIETIGSDWKVLDFATFQFNVLTNKFFIIKMASGDYYKLRVISFYGDTTAERVIKIEYALVAETLPQE
ncbi:HmuY family protein [Carboxylicivirga sp. RSCT41]|uniref:HmuY family protein n=1 Tax=Carboxylicivirga agarovorans TaxID=3417570 RepID=UPI003D3384D9